MSAARALLDDPGLARVLALLNGDGEEARVVGGAVRNALMGRPATDFDITTTALPETVVVRAKNVGLRTIPTGLAHGTVTVLVEGRPYEVTTLREDIETDGRHAKIRFGRDFSLDALRRDFTINALSMGLDGEVYDYAGGLADIEAGRVRFIGDPTTRIREDYLRILRFFRFSADYAAGAFDAAAIAACICERGGLERLSRERVRQEVLKLLAARRAVEAVRAMSETGLLGPLLQGVPQPLRLARLVAIDPHADRLLRLAATACIVQEDAERLRDALRLSKAETARLIAATRAREAMGAELPSPARLRERLFAEGRVGALDGLKLAWVESRAAPDAVEWQDVAAFLQNEPEPVMPFTAADLIARGLVPGKALGQALKRLQANWVDAGFPHDSHRLTVLLETVAPNRQPLP